MLLNLKIGFIRLSQIIVCLAQILLTQADCPLCACRYVSVDSLSWGLCPDCLDFFGSLTAIKTTLSGDDAMLAELTCFSAGFYEGLVRESVHQIKYLKNRQLLRFVGASMQAPTVALFKDLDKRLPQDYFKRSKILLLPVPLHKDRLKQRSFNQAAAFAEHVQKSAPNMRLCLKGLRRVRVTKPQFGLSQNDRRSNLAKAFEADKRLINGRAVIIVDDILTSGATLYECAIAATAAGATVLGALTFGRARWQTQGRDQAHISVPPVSTTRPGPFFPETSAQLDRDGRPQSARHHPGCRALL